MAQYMQWTEQLGDAVLAQRPDVMDAIQRLRARANQYGYFQDPQFRRYERVSLNGPGAIEIDPVGDEYYVPSYNSQIFFGGSRRGFGSFTYGPGVSVGGGSFTNWGWGPGYGFGWRDHSIRLGATPGIEAGVTVIDSTVRLLTDMKTVGNLTRMPHSAAENGARTTVAIIAITDNAAKSGADDDHRDNREHNQHRDYRGRGNR